jgi:hypothetical protein
VLKLSWYGLWRPGDVPLPALFVDQAERWLPEAVPRRYGLGERFRTKYADGGVDAMVRAWQSREPTSLGSPLDFSVDFPLEFVCGTLRGQGSMTTTAGIAKSKGMWKLELLCVKDDFVAVEPRRRLLALFTGVAEGASVEYATAEVGGKAHWLDAFVGLELDRELFISPWQDWWMDWRGLIGLTPYPTWWSWFGPSYLPLVQERLDRPPSGWRVTPTGRGTLLELADLPSGRKELRGPVGRWLGLGWMPSELRVRRGRRSPKAARVLPDW